MAYYPRIFLQRMVQKYDQIYSSYPVLTAGSTMGTKASCCDLLAQQIEDPNCHFDLKRTAKFGGFCVFYVGMFQHMLFNKLYPYLFPGTGLRVAIQKTFCDNFVHTPFVYLPAYFSYKSLTSGGCMTEGLYTYQSEGYGVLSACWALWIPAQFITFYAVPPNFRILWSAFVGSSWEVILSLMSPLVESDRIESIEKGEVDSDSDCQSESGLG